VVEQHLAWTTKAGIKDILIDEIEMLHFHLRSGMERLNGVMPNGYFPLAVQLLWADPTIWLMFHQMLPEHPVFLIAHPLPIRYYEKGEVSCIFYEGDNGKYKTVTSLCAEALLFGDKASVKYTNPQKPFMWDAFTRQAFQGKRYADLPNGGKTIEVLVDFLKNNSEKEWTVVKELGIDDMHIYRSGAAISHNFTKKEKLHKPRISLPFSLVSVNSDDMCETGVPYQVIKASHDTRQVPVIGRFRPSTYDESFVGSVQLEGVGPLYDMIRCLKRPDHPTVRAAVKRWSCYDRSNLESKKQYMEWQRIAAKQTRIAFEYLKEDEMAMFPGNKSYFRCKRDALEVPAEDDNEYIEISSSEES
jgi:hypothetical protein